MTADCFAEDRRSGYGAPVFGCYWSGADRSDFKTEAAAVESTKRREGKG